MKALDYYLQNWRIDVVRPHLRPTDRILDIGSFDGALARRVGKYSAYVGIDPEADPSKSNGDLKLFKGLFPQDLPPQEPFDAITMLAILEHIPEDVMAGFARSCSDALKPGGKLLLTVPHPFVDKILDVLMAVKILDGMETEAHHGFDVSQTPTIFKNAGFEMIAHKRFQLGLNNFYAFQKK